MTLSTMEDHSLRRQQVAAVERELRDMKSENEALRQIIDGKYPGKLPWDLRKVARQRAALDRLNRKVVSQRFVLRTLEELGRGLSPEEYRTARAAIENEQLRQRIEDPANTK